MQDAGFLGPDGEKLESETGARAVAKQASDSLRERLCVVAGVAVSNQQMNGLCNGSLQA